MEMRAGFPEFISTLRANNAGLPRQAKSLVMAGRHKSLKFDEILANARRSFGSLGGGGRQDVLITEEAVGPLESDGGQDPRVAYKKAKKQGAGKKKKDGVPKRGGGEVKEGGGRHAAVLTVVRASVIGSTGAIGITIRRQSARGGTLREGIEARRPRDAIRLESHPTFQRIPQFKPRKRNA